MMKNRTKFNALDELLIEHNEKLFMTDYFQVTNEVAVELNRLLNMDDVSVIDFVENKIHPSNLEPLWHCALECHILAGRVNLFVNSERYDIRELLAASQFITTESIDELITQGHNSVLGTLARNNRVTEEQVDRLLETGDFWVQLNVLDRSDVKRSIVMDLLMNSEDAEVASKALKRITEKELLFMIVTSVYGTNR